MKSRKSSAVLALASVGLLTHSGIAQSQTGWEYKFPQRVYLAIGSGQSTLDPDTGPVDGLEVIDGEDSGTSYAIGWDFSRRMSAELQHVDLGDAVLSQDGLISYAETSLSAIYYFWNHRTDDQFADMDGLDLREGLSVFGRFGLGSMDNEANLEFARENDVTLLGGFGVEYGFSRAGLGVRAEYISYDSDAKYTALSLIFRFGLPSSGAPDLDTPIPEPSQTPVPQLPQQQPLPGSSGNPDLGEGTTGDSDADGIPDLVDDCADTPFGSQVDEFGCQEQADKPVDGVLEGVTFGSGSARLTAEAQQVLDRLAQELIATPQQRISIEAHTDSRGGEKANLEISRKRALAVVRYLTVQGVALDRFQARAFGERRPIASNDTAEGRRANRRVEIRYIE